MAKSTTSTIALPDEVKAGFEALAQTTGRSEDVLMTEALLQYLEREAWQIARIEEGIRALEAGEIATDTEMQALWDRTTTPEGMGRARDEARRAYGC